MVTRAFTISRINPAVEHLPGYDAAGMVDRPLTEFVQLPDLAGGADPLVRVLATAATCATSPRSWWPSPPAAPGRAQFVPCATATKSWAVSPLRAGRPATSWKSPRENSPMPERKHILIVDDEA